MRLRSISVSLGIGACIAVAAAYWHRADHPFSKAPVSPAASVGSDQPRSTGTLASTEGLQLEYDVNFESTLEAGAESATTITGSVRWTLTPTTWKGPGQRFLGIPRAASVTVDQPGEDGAILAQSMTQGLQERFGIELAPDGSVRRVGVPPRGTVGPNLLKDLASGLQYVRAPQKQAADWTSREKDHLGDAVATYHRLPNGNVRKTKQYSAPALPKVLFATEREAPHIDASSLFAFEVAATGFPSHAETLEQLRTPAFSSTTKSSFALASVTNGAVAPQSALDGLRWVDLSEVIAGEQDPNYELGRKRRLLGGKGFENLLADLAQFPLAKADTAQSRHLALRRLTALFDLDPQAIADAKKALRSGKAGSDASALLGALSDSDSPAARDALADLGKDTSLPSGLREDAIANLSLKAAPSAATFEDLRALSKSDDEAVRGSAVLALGTTARGAREDAQPQALEARRELAEGVKTAVSSDDKVMYLTGAGNAGGQTAMESAEAALRDPRPDVREAAVMALRFAPAPQAEQLLIAVWPKDPAGSVRAAVSTAAGFRPLSPELLATASAVLQTDSEMRVRLSVIRYLGAFLGQSPLIAQALEATAKTDPSPEVREAAARALGSI